MAMRKLKIQLEVDVRATAIERLWREKISAGISQVMEL